MMMQTTVVALMGLVAMAEASVIDRFAVGVNQATEVKRANTNGGNNNAGSATCLAANALQTGSFSTGQQAGVAANGQSNSATDKANFINFCSGQTLTNGLQIKTGSCNGIVMGKIPATTAMVSTVILNPKLNDNLPSFQTFNVTATIANMNLGSFTNATDTYYSAPQDLGGNGAIIGHTHITIQDVGSSFQFTSPLDATKFVFFKGINDAGNGQGTVTTAVTGGLPPSNYRVCTMSSSSNHQPVLMPVAQRGAQDDCRYFTVSGSASAGSSSTNNAAGGSGSASGSAASASSSAASASSSAAASSGKTGTSGAATSTGKGSKGGNGGKAGAGTGSSTTAAAAAAASETTTSSAEAAAATTSAAAAGAAGKGGKGSKSGKGNKAQSTSSAPSVNTSTAAAATAATKAASTSGASATASSSTTNNASTGSTSTSGALGGIAAPPVTDSGDKTRPFEVNGNTFVNKAAAVQRACAIQNNACANAVNAGKLAGVTVSDCNTQEETCNSSQ